jgi:hypothetical protein
MKESNTVLDEKASLSVVASVCSENKAVRRSAISALEMAMLQHDQVEIPVNHRFSGDIYAREITIPKGTLLTGRIHKFDHFDIMLSGDVTVSTDTGETKRLTGLNIMEGKAGKKRAGYAHEDTHWITFHSAEERDPEEMYEFLTCGSFEELGDFNALLDQADYKSLVNQLGMNEEEIQEQANNEDDFIDVPGITVVVVGSSAIHGQGLIATNDIPKGCIIMPARIGEKRTIAGRYTNHAMTPNAKMIVTDLGVDLVALRGIEENEEITVNYGDILAHRADQGDLCQQ